jgi:drug/metabolite transporter (DMT)-like permease
MSHFLMIFISVLLTAIGQLFFKKGMSMIALDPHQANWWKVVAQGLVNSYVWAGFFSFGAGALLWLAVLAREELSYAYPLSSLGYLAVLIGAALFFHEQISLSRIIGVLIIMAGVFFIEYSR